MEAAHTKQLFRHKSWISNLGYYLGIVTLLNLLINFNLTYFVWLLILYFIGTIVVSVGLHRLFSHKAFKTSRFWHYILAFGSVFYLYNSPIQWAVGHSAHHKFSDTSKDPHYKFPQTWITRGYRETELNIWNARRLMRDPMQVFIDKYYLLILILGIVLLTAINLDLLLYVYLPVIGLTHLVGCIHNTFSHSKISALNKPYMEFIVPLAGEWLHLNHHNKERLADFRSEKYQLDYGYWFIKLIQTK